MAALELRYDSTDDEIPLFQRHNYNHPYSDCTPAKRQETRPLSRRERFYKNIKESCQKSQSDIPTHVDQHEHSTKISHNERSEAPRQKEPKDVPRVVQEGPFQPHYQSLAVHVKPPTTQIHPRQKNVSWLDQMFKSKLFKNKRRCVCFLILLSVLCVVLLLGSITLVSLPSTKYFKSKLLNDTDTIYIAPFSVFNYPLHRLTLSYSGVTLKLIQEKEKSYQYEDVIGAAVSHEKLSTRYIIINRTIEVTKSAEIVRYWTTLNNTTGEIVCSDNTIVKWGWNYYYNYTKLDCQDTLQEMQCNGDQKVSAQKLEKPSVNQDLITILFCRTTSEQREIVTIRFDEELPNVHDLKFSYWEIRETDSLTIQFEDLVPEHIHTEKSQPILYISTKNVVNNHYHYEPLQIQLKFIPRRNLTIWKFGFSGIGFSLLMLITICIIAICYYKHRK